MRRSFIAVALGSALLIPWAFYGQAPASITPRDKGQAAKDVPRADVRVDANLVLIPVAVNDELGRPVAGLDKEHFHVTDDKQPQTISTFSMDDSPVALGLVFDTSSSMKPYLAAARRAASLFVAMANPGDEFLLVEFDSRPRITVPLTDDLAHIRYELTFTQSKGSTALIDAVYMAMHEIKKSTRQRKALIVVSDGGDNNSRYTTGELKTVLQESSVLIYSVGIISYDEPYGPGLMRRIAEETGGRLFLANSGLPDIASKISIDLRNRYVLGYTPTNTNRDGRYHKVEVQLTPPKALRDLNLKPYWRKGYYAPSE
jgi:Ca-activated chloride channel homolog